ncbi:BTAD domain-containing putative transcriptional regulator [Micromonospora sp. NPDC048930]|uniref:AfsR/SARP family transcriptional regulator n=1 Tax=Micromonospora sp. NPDC048930 TaxID=3364261 RepID=UPI00371663CC
MAVEYRLLGPVQVIGGEQPVDTGPPRQRSVLAALTVDAGRVVEWDTLVDRVWGEDAPVDARGSIRAHVTRIRQVLRQAAGTAAPPRLVHRSGGYALEVDEEHVDLHRFRRLVLRAGETHDNQERLAVLRAAVGLWRGAPLAGIAGEWAARMRDSWTKERLDAVVAWAHAEIAVHNAAATIGPLADLAAQHPLVESVTAALMRAQHALGRTADAVQEYTVLRTRLAEALGVDPEPELQSLYQALLRGEPLPPLASSSGVASMAAPPATPPVITPLPAQLPADVHGFVGRAEALAGLDALLGESAQTPTAVVIATVSGTAGVGKTTVAVHWGHRVASRFPDGQLYVNLRGFDPGGVPVRPTDALRGFLEAFGVPAERIPAELDVQAARYRSLLAGKRVLVVLDNARDAEQVRPLLPGTSTSLTVVTSRNQLGPLVTLHGARPFAMEVLSPVEARQMLAHRLGADRVAAEPEAVDHIIDACARLPLALAIVSARAQQTAFPLAAIAGELDDVHGRLDALDAGDPTSQVRAVFSWSYAALTSGAARLFRLLGLPPGPDVSARAVASLAGRPPTQTRRLIVELVRANLLAESAPGRYALHDLLRVYATEQLSAAHSHVERRAALSRLLAHYVHTAHTANRLIHPHRDPIPVALGTPSPDSTPVKLVDQHEAQAWLATERNVLLAALRRAADAGFNLQAWQLAWALDTYLERRGYWYDRSAAWHTALQSANRLGSRAARAGAHVGIAHNELRLNRPTSAHDHLRQALDLYISGHDLAGQAFVHGLLAYLCEHQDSFEAALDHARQALALYRAAGHERGQATALNAVGWYHTLLGDHTSALVHCEEALALLQGLQDRYGAATTWDSLGHAHHHLGRYGDAAHCYQQALSLFRALGYRAYEADTLTHVGDTHLAAGDLDAARAAWKQALTILTDLDQSQCESVRAKLNALPDR